MGPFAWRPPFPEALRRKETVIFVSVFQRLGVFSFRIANKQILNHAALRQFIVGHTLDELAGA
jgi:hypothetical protein